MGVEYHAVALALVRDSPQIDSAFGPTVCGKLTKNRPTSCCGLIVALSFDSRNVSERRSLRPVKIDAHQDESSPCCAHGSCRIRCTDSSYHCRIAES